MIDAPTSRFSNDKMSLDILDDEYFWMATPFDYTTSTLGNFEIKILVQPFKTDLSSHPWFTYMLLPPKGKYNKPAIVHDYLLQHRALHKGLTRRDIDLIFIEAMEDVGVAKWRCVLMYLGVRANSIYKEGLR